VPVLFLELKSEQCRQQGVVTGRAGVAGKKSPTKETFMSTVMSTDLQTVPRKKVI
jgi:hypothetical protein